MKMRVELGERGYDITVCRGAMKKAGEIFDLCRRVLVVTDDGVPAEYARAVAEKCKESKIFTFPQGEASKNADTYIAILKEMLAFGLSRTDCVVAVGGGVVGDIAGFAAATYMRGIDFYNVPTTLLSAVDSSIGGKTAINLCGVKNVVGAFYQPKAVLIDPDALKTLPDRQISSGMAEAIKMAATSDHALFEKIESGGCDIEDIIVGSLKIKKAVVEADEREAGLRRVLNFGHTIGHGIEASSGGALYHGECVALGMLPMCKKDVRERLLLVLKKYGLPTEFHGDIAAVKSAVLHDKKSSGDTVYAVIVNKIGSYEIIKETPDGITSRMTAVWGNL